MLKADVFRAHAFRLALAFVLAIAAATASVFALIYFQVSREDTDRVGTILVDEARLNVDADEGRLRAALAARQMPDIRRIDYIALFDARGALVVGNLSSMPQIPVDGRAHFVSAQEVKAANAQPEAALFVARRRADGGLLALGRGLRDSYDLENALLRALAVALAPTVALILGIGAFFARRASQRLLGVQGAIARVMDGDLGSRLPVSKDDDDVDRVVRGVNLMLDEIARLLEQSKSVGDNIAHDLRSPLSVARAKLERALEDLSESHAASAQLTGALAQIDKAAVTIDALLRISTVENGPRKRRFQDVDLAEICAQAFEFYEPLAESKSIQFSASCPAPIWIRGDADLLREAISNVVDNAIKFTPAGGAVRIRTAIVDRLPFAEISDTGPGVSPSERENIFRRFYRADANAGDGSYGIGLSIAQTIAKLHGLELTVEDNEPGARFVMRAVGKTSLSLGTGRHEPASQAT
jgi:signal transduction histidine kinase